MRCCTLQSVVVFVRFCLDIFWHSKVAPEVDVGWNEAIYLPRQSAIVIPAAEQVFGKISQGSLLTSVPIGDKLAGRYHVVAAAGVSGFPNGCRGGNSKRVFPDNGRIGNGVQGQGVRLGLGMRVWRAHAG